MINLDHNNNCCQLVEQIRTLQLNENKKEFIENRIKLSTYPLMTNKINKNLRTSLVFIKEKDILRSF